MRKTTKRCVCAFLLLSMLTTLLACDAGERGETSQDGIHISDEQAYSEQAMEYAEDTIYPLLIHYAKKTSGLQNLPEAKQTELSAVASDVADILAEKPVREDIYIRALDEIRLRGEGVVDEMILFGDEGGELTKTRELYLSLVSLLDSRTVSSAVYSLALYGYDHKYDSEIAKSEKYEDYKDMYEARAEAVKAEREVFVGQIGRERFCNVFLQALALSELVSGDIFLDGEMGAFTNEEVLLFLQSLELSETDIGDEGWQLIFEKILPSSSGDEYSSKIFSKMLSNGDYKNISAVMNDASALISVICERMTAYDVELLREGDTKLVIRRAMQRFTDEDFVRLSRIFSVNIKNEDYHAIALSFYGVGYAEYAESISPIGLSELREDLDKETFYESLERYVAGASPAFSYGMNE